VSRKNHHDERKQKKQNKCGNGGAALFFFLDATTTITHEGKPMRPVKRQRLVNRILALIAVTAALSGCSLNTDIGGPTAIVILNGQNQMAATSTTLPTAFTVVVVGSFNVPMPDQPVTWTIVAPGTGSLSTASSVTDQNGLASTTYTTGSAPGTVQIQASSNSLDPVLFYVTVN
jgi:hypothetical protein